MEPNRYIDSGSSGGSQRWRCDVDYLAGLDALNRIHEGWEKRTVAFHSTP
jgi:hypothetical protein